MSKNSYVCEMSSEQADKLRHYLEEQGWELDTIQYARFRGRKDKTTVTAYESGKVTVQGRGTEALVTFFIEPEVLKTVRFGYEDVIAKAESPDMFKPHAGIDESGKGDFFGPLVISCVYVDEWTSEKLFKGGIQDSKAIKSDKKIHELAELVRKTVRGKYSMVRIGPAAYNRMYGTMKNVNRMLAWGHARALENLLERVPDCERAISDQFGRKSTVERALMERGQNIVLEQMHKAEADIAVAAASILARDGFVTIMDELSEKAGLTLPKGASQQVIAAAAKVLQTHGEEEFGEYAKLHFQTANKARIKAGMPAILPSGDGN